jgi:hypothetical protein
MQLVTTQDITLKLNVPFSTRWIDEFIKLNASPELIHLYPDSKEITESMATFGAIRKERDLYPDILSDHKVLCVVPGDGVLPRTGALAAYRTKWEVHSVDPRMRLYNRTVNHLTCHTKKIEECDFSTNHIAIILSTHSHVELDTVIEHVKAPRYVVVACECCVKMNITGVEPRCVWRDSGVFGHCNLMKMWSFTKER